MSKLNTARKLTREAGVDEVSENGTSNLTFWTFVQLARMLRTEHDKAEEAALEILQRELKFSDGEIEDFRQVFRTWVKRAETIMEQRPGHEPPQTLNRDMVRRLVRSLGISISPANAGVLDQKLMTLDEMGRLETMELDFFGFLRLMRWILDTDFAGINDAAAKLA